MCGLSCPETEVCGQICFARTVCPENVCADFLRIPERVSKVCNFETASIYIINFGNAFWSKISAGGGGKF